MKRLPSLSLLLLGLVLTACGSLPPVPVDHFYRLQPASVAAAGRALPAPIFVAPFRADSLYAERPVVYSEAGSPRELRQYHYHLWLYPPAQMVQQHFIASLGAALDLSADSGAAQVVEGRVLGFERLVAGKRNSAVVVLELRLLAGGKTRVNKVYRAEQPAGDDSMGAFAAAVEQALAIIYKEFLADAAPASSGR